ncbi:FecR domain-containing protein [Fulvivirgaceae bacterium PWU4]|uniref:FecR domain-containing protein n=1 Tax=Chryseosolibacter histidini TaxID=2782349 RepID=A0AAP2DLV4_9BACT|nr:FecR domain-containing protein [Chryseosolibacter histidini]MBT1698761.1 FecR domain-containing protein [Chryseosolibacter histidini]
MKDIEHYTLEDLIQDRSFIEYVEKSNAESISFWEAQRTGHPDKRQMFDAAAWVIKGPTFNRKTLPDQVVNAEWQRLSDAINRGAQQNTSPWYRYRWAASVAALAFLATFVWLFVLNRDITHATAFGEIAEVSLPDGSSVMLNANSRLSYAASWADDEPREVWLTGEAFFEVKKRNTADGRFIVHSKNTRVEVLGTSFNVNNRKQETTVVLNTGRVALQKDDDRDTVRVMMKPGDLVTLSPVTNRVKKQRVNPEIYSSWKDHKFIFDNTPLYEVAILIEENYGKEVLIREESLKNRVLSGEIPVPSIDVLLEALSRSFDIKVTQKDNQIILEKKM